MSFVLRFPSCLSALRLGRRQFPDKRYLGASLLNFGSEESSLRNLQRAAATGSKMIWQYPITKEAETLYDHPELYECAFSYRDIKLEIKFLREAYAKHTDGAPLNSVLELGCGPASHSIGLAHAGIPNVIGIDLNENMLQYARWKYDPSGKTSSSAKSKGFQAPAKRQPLQLLKGDMSSFEIEGAPFDMVMCLLGTFSHMLDNTQASNAFARVSKHLRPGGLMVLELGHPGDLFDGTYILGDGGKDVWEVKIEEDRKVVVEWGAEFDNFDPVTQVLHRTVSVNVLKGDEVEQSMEEVLLQRQFTVQELNLLGSINGLHVQELYGEMDLGVDLSHEEAYRMIAVFKKI